MIIFIDESGDTGFKISKGSTEAFVICLVIFDEELDAEEAALEIKKLRKELKKSDFFEFKFTKCKKDLRIQFLKTVAKCSFRIRAIVFQKEIIYSPVLRTSKDKFYNFALKQVLEHNNSTIKNAKIRLDGLGEKAFKRQLTTYLRKNLNSHTKKVMENLRFKDSKKDVLIQMADMIAGSIRKSYRKTEADSKIYRQILKKKEEDVWEFK